MQQYKRMSKRTLALLVAGMMATGGIALVGIQAFAQSNLASNTPVSATAQTQDVGAKLSDKTEVIVDAKTGVVTKEVTDQEGIEHQDSGKLDREANGVETNDGPDAQN